MHIIPESNTNFKAKLDVSSVKLNKTRWNNIAKIFSEESKSLPNGLINVFHDERQCCFFAFSNLFENDIYSNLAADLYEDVSKKMFETKSDDVIAKALVNFMSLGTIAGDKLQQAGKRARKMAENYLFAEQKIKARAIFAEQTALIKKEICSMAEQDEMMKDWYISV